MKKIKFVLPVLAFALAIFVSAFTAQRKVPQKQVSLYWYKVTYDVDHPDGAILNSSDFYVQADQSNVNSPCDAGSNEDCLRGFPSQLTSFPEESSGSGQITKP